MKVIFKNSTITFQTNGGVLGVELFNITTSTPDSPVYETTNDGQSWSMKTYERWTKQSLIDIPSIAKRVYGSTSFYNDGHTKISGIMFFDNDNNVVSFLKPESAGIYTPIIKFDTPIPSGATKLLIQALSTTDSVNNNTVKFGA